MPAISDKPKRRDFQGNRAKKFVTNV
jgi:hypothetical protein